MKKTPTGTDSVLTAPCISHPCGSAVGKNPCQNCAFSRTDTQLNQTQQIISAAAYGCKMGGSIEKHGDDLYMRVGQKLFPERAPINMQVIAAQNTLRVFIGN